MGIFDGTLGGPKTDVVCLNAGAALFVAEAVRSITEGFEKARELIASGAARAKLDQLRRAL